jgi:hypothetical protein
MSGYGLGAAKVTADPVWAIQVLSNYDPALVHNSDDRACGQTLHAQSILKTLQPSACDQHGPQSPIVTFNSAGNIHDPLSANSSNVDFADRETVTSQDLAKMEAIFGISPSSSLPRSPDIFAVEREQVNAAHEVG